MAQSLRPCPQCRKLTDSRLPLCPDCQRAGDPTLMQMPPYQAPQVPPSVQTVFQAPPNYQQQPPLQPTTRVEVKSGGFLSGLGSGFGFCAGGCVLFPLFCLFMLSTTLNSCSSDSPGPVSSAYNSPQAGQPGPTFEQADQVMHDQPGRYTQAQKDAYWQSVKGTRVTWTGDVMNADLNEGGRIYLRCNPKNSGQDVELRMEPAQSNLVTSVSKGQRLTVSGILEEHSSFGYKLTGGRIEGH